MTTIEDKTEVPSRAATPRLEDLIGGRVLAWTGGIAVLVGVVFLLAIAISRGWIGEEARTAMAAAVSLGLLLVGVGAYERRGRTEAALAATAAGIAALFATAVVATRVYDLVPAVVGFLLAAAVGAAATVLAIRWRAQGIGALGIVGALLGPVLTGAPGGLGTTLLLLVAVGSATAVLVWQRWSWLAFATFLIATPQWVAFISTGTASVAVVLLVLAGFWGLSALAAAGFELRMAAPRLRPASAILLALNGFTCAAAGWYALDGTAGRVWLVALAAAHLGVALAGPRSRRVSAELGLVAQGLGLIIADVATAQILSGLPLLLAWASGIVGFAFLARRARGRGKSGFAALGLGGHVALALAHALFEDAPASALGGGGALPVALLALGALAAACFSSARLLQDGHRGRRIALDALGLVVVAYLWASALDGIALVLAWSAQAVALAGLARRGPSGRDAVAIGGAFAFLAGALCWTLVDLAAPKALVYGLGSVVPGVAALGAVAAVAAIAAARMPSLHPVQRPALFATAAIVALYAVSCGLVTAFQPGADTADLPLAALGVRQQGQALLSALWGLAGVAALVAGLGRDLRSVRLAGLGLLGLAATKVFLFDLASLTSIYRVASFIALGLLLLCGAFAWQRLRPRPLPDLRQVSG